MAIELTDDGTMDTVLRCSECGEEFRFNYDPAEPITVHCQSHDSHIPGCVECEQVAEQDCADGYEAFIEECIEEIESEHECQSDDEPSDDEPDEDSITTTDHQKFYQYHRLVLEQDDEPNTDRWFYRADNGRQECLGTGFADCESALRAYMERVQFWPNVFFISDHGNAHRIVL